MAVADMEVLGFNAAVIDDNASISQHTVDVQQQQANLRGLFDNRG
jgi:hypothetical protein